MSWAAFLTLVEAETGATGRAAVEERARVEQGGLRLRIPPPGWRQITAAEIAEALAACRWNVREAAARLGVSPSTAYRRCRPPRQALTTGA